jgi:hypothetical protein
MRRASSMVGVSLLVFSLAAPAVSAGGGTNASAAVPQPSSMGRYVKEHGYIPYGGPAAYAQMKAAADARAGNTGAAPPPANGSSPIAGPSWEGVHNGGITPPDSTGAIGTYSYIEFVNLNYAIYSRTGALLDIGTAQNLTGISNGCLSDPQMVWDTFQSRFYYLILDVCTNSLAWGYSKTDNPLSSTEFCKYEADFGYGSNLPDYPKLGTTEDFLIVGVNVFSPNGYVGSDVDWINRDAASGSCPASSSFGTGRFGSLKNVDGSSAVTPEPAVETDPSPVGWVVSTRFPSGSFLTVFQVKPDPSDPSVAQISAPASVAVPTYGIPADAQQCNSQVRLDTLDGRLEHAVSGIDPNQGNQVGVWTAHAVFGGAGSEERWYEINPLPLGSPSLFQSGKAGKGSLFVWNGAVSPDRSVHEDGTAGFGGDMVMGFNTSNGLKCVAIKMVSKLGSSPQSRFVRVKASHVAENDFSCSPCRWGDYSGATPDPAADLGLAAGRVWLTNELAGGTYIRTWNWGATP